MNKRFPLLYTSLILTAILAVFHYLASVFYLYWVYWWADVIMHFFAGVCGALTAYAVLFDSGWWKLWQKEFPPVWTRMLIVFISVMIFGVAWEIFEYVYGFTDSIEGYALDTVHDFINDALGAIFALWTVRRILKLS